MIHCKRCKSTGFRRTRIEDPDRLKLFLFQYPVRCRKCGHRTSVSIFSAFLHAVPRDAPHKGNGPGQSWTEFTSVSHPAPTRK